MIRVRSNNIIVEPIKEEKSVSGIELPYQQEKIGFGRVLFVGTDAKDVSMNDTVIHSLAFDEIEMNGTPCRLMSEDEVYAIYEEGDI